MFLYSNTLADTPQSSIGVPTDHEKLVVERTYNQLVNNAKVTRYVTFYCLAGKLVRDKQFD